VAHRDGNGASRLRVAPWLPSTRSPTSGAAPRHSRTAGGSGTGVDDRPPVDVTASLEPVPPADGPPEPPSLLRPVSLGRAGNRRGRWWFVLVPAAAIVLVIVVAVQLREGPAPWRPPLPEMSPQVVLPELTAQPSAGASTDGPTASASPSGTRRTGTSAATGAAGAPGGTGGPGSGTGTAAPAPPAAAAAVQPGSIVAADGRCLEAEAARSDAAIRLAECAAVERQKWSRSGGTVRVQGFCLDVFYDRRDNGAEVLLYDCHGGGNQQWRIGAGGLVNPQSGRCLTAVPVGLVIADCTGGANQRWSLA
jgi:Ricin-type beta-trefoil lectin domain